ncbi:ketohydroxyglutarate aldolase, partial [Vibrio parahaemolyticus]
WLVPEEALTTGNYEKITQLAQEAVLGAKR